MVISLEYIYSVCTLVSVGCIVDAVSQYVHKSTHSLSLHTHTHTHRLAVLNQKLTSLERQVEYIEARVTKT